MNFKIRVRGRGTGSGTRRETQIKIIEILFFYCPFKDFCTLVFLSFLAGPGLSLWPRTGIPRWTGFRAKFQKAESKIFIIQKLKTRNWQLFFPVKIRTWSKNRAWQKDQSIMFVAQSRPYANKYCICVKFTVTILTLNFNLILKSNKRHNINNNSNISMMLIQILDNPYSMNF